MRRSLRICVENKNYHAPSFARAKRSLSNISSRIFRKFYFYDSLLGLTCKFSKITFNRVFYAYNLDCAMLNCPIVANIYYICSTKSAAPKVLKDFYGYED